MAPQVASLSELSRIRGDAEVRYPYAITELTLSPPGLDRDRETEGGGGRKMRVFEGRRCFLEQRVKRERVGERHKGKEGRQAAAR